MVGLAETMLKLHKQLPRTSLVRRIGASASVHDQRPGWGWESASLRDRSLPCPVN
jgi:hypothetical protein